MGRSLTAVGESSRTREGGTSMSVRRRERKSWMDGRGICRRERANFWKSW